MYCICGSNSRKRWFRMNMRFQKNRISSKKTRWYLSCRNFESVAKNYFLKIFCLNFSKLNSEFLLHSWSLSKSQISVNTFKTKVSFLCMCSLFSLKKCQFLAKITKNRDFQDYFFSFWNIFTEVGFDSKHSNRSAK